MRHPLVSIIIPCFKQIDYLPETLSSVSSQTYRNWECVIVNDGSPDNTEEVAKEYCRKDPRFRYVSQDNWGVSAARNTGIGHSNGEFILPLDADDLIEPSYIEKAIDHFLSFPDTKLVYSKADKFGIENIYWDLPPYEYDQFIWSNCIFCSAIFKRTDFNLTKGYNENMVNGNEDWDFFLSLLNREDSVYRIDEILFHYRVKETSRSTEMVAKYKEASLIQLYKNHPDIYEPYMKEYCERIVFKKTEDAELMELRGLRDNYENICASTAYRLGKTLLSPISYIRKWFNI